MIIKGIEYNKAYEIKISGSDLCFVIGAVVHLMSTRKEILEGSLSSLAYQLPFRLLAQCKENEVSVKFNNEDKDSIVIKKDGSLELRADKEVKKEDLH